MTVGSLAPRILMCFFALTISFGFMKNIEPLAEKHPQIIIFCGCFIVDTLNRLLYRMLAGLRTRLRWVPNWQNILSSLNMTRDHWAVVHPVHVLSTEIKSFRNVLWVKKWLSCCVSTSKVELIAKTTSNCSQACLYTWYFLFHIRSTQERRSGGT